MVLNITVFSWEKCPACVKAKELLRSCRLQYREVDIQVDPAMRDVVQNLIGADKRLTVPQIFFHNTHIGGCSELQTIITNHQLPEMMQRAASSRPLRPELRPPGHEQQHGGAPPAAAPRPEGRPQQGYEGHPQKHHRPHPQPGQPQAQPQRVQKPQQQQPQQQGCPGGVCPLPQARPQPQCAGGVCAMPPRQAGRCG